MMMLKESYTLEIQRDVMIIGEVCNEKKVCVTRLLLQKRGRDGGMEKRQENCCLCVV